MKDLAAWIVAILMMIVAFRYAYQIYRKEISPTLSTWLIFLAGTSLSFISYMVAEKHDFKSGVLNTVDFGVSLIIVLAILFWGQSLKVSFKPFEKKYLVGAAGIIIFWIFSQNAFASNLLFQVLILVGYLPTIQNLIEEKRNTESFSVWSIVLAAALVSLYPSISGGNTLAVVYTARTIVMVGLVLSFMTWYTIRGKFGLEIS